MAGPFIFIGTHRIRQGRLEDFKRDMVEFSRFVEEHEPQLIAFNMYLDWAENEVSVVQVHPDVGSMENHMRVVSEHIASAYADTLEETTSMQVYGALSNAARETMRQYAGPDVPLIVMEQHLAGFTRSSASAQPTTA